MTPRNRLSRSVTELLGAAVWTAAEAEKVEEAVEAEVANESVEAVLLVLLLL